MVEIHSEISIVAPREACFDLARSIDFHVHAARIISGGAIGEKVAGLAGDGDRVRWRARFFGLPFAMTTEVCAYERPDAFDDVMVGGLMKSFRHQYRFRDDGDHTVLEDRFSFSSPWWCGGWIAEQVIEPTMRRAQAERLRLLKETLEMAGAADRFLKIR